jgi:hypothetical protein
VSGSLCVVVCMIVVKRAKVGDVGNQECTNE